MTEFVETEPINKYKGNKGESTWFEVSLVIEETDMAAVSSVMDAILDIAREEGIPIKKYYEYMTTELSKAEESIFDSPLHIPCPETIIVREIR